MRERIPQAEQLIQCPSCKEHVEICNAVLVEGLEFCDGCADNLGSIENDHFLSEEISDSQKEKSYIRKNIQGEFEDDFSKEHMDA